MDLSSDPSQDEARIMERKLYRAGETPAAAKTPVPATSRTAIKAAPTPSVKKASTRKPSEPPTGKKRILLMLLLLGFGYYLVFGTPRQRRRVLVGLGVAAWMLLLGSISYCLCLPDLEGIAQDRRAIFTDQSLSWEQKREKLKEIDSKLTKEERQQMREIDRKAMERKMNTDMHNFFMMSKEEQVAYLKKRDEERKAFREKMRAAWGGGGPGGGGPGGPGGGGGGGGRGGNGGGGGGGGGMAARGGGGGPGGGGPPGGGPGGGWGGRGGEPGQGQKARLDSMSPETRAGFHVMRNMQQQLGLGGGGRRP